MDRHGRSPHAGPPPPPRALLWASLLATPLLWFASFMAAFLYAEATCSAPTPDGGAGDVDTVLTVAMLATAVLSGAITLATHRIARRARSNRERYDDFLPQAGFLTGLLFTFVVLAHLVPIALVGACRIVGG